MEDFFSVINLSERKDRRDDMEKQLGRIGWKAEFFGSVRPSDAGGFESVGARSCFESHLHTLRRASISGFQREQKSC
jgi:glycosyl transferase, family 25